MAIKNKFENIKYSSSTYFNANEYRWKNLKVEKIKKKIIYFSRYKKII